MLTSVSLQALLAVVSTASGPTAAALLLCEGISGLESSESTPSRLFCLRLLLSLARGGDLSPDALLACTPYLLAALSSTYVEVRVAAAAASGVLSEAAEESPARLVLNALSASSEAIAVDAGALPALLHSILGGPVSASRGSTEKEGACQACQGHLNTVI